jgi:hypothetical protein
MFFLALDGCCSEVSRRLETGMQLSYENEDVVIHHALFRDECHKADQIA